MKPSWKSTYLIVGQLYILNIIFINHMRSENRFKQYIPAKIFSDTQEPILSNYQGTSFCNWNAYERISWLVVT